MSKYNLMVLWENVFPHQNEAYDYAGRRILKSAIGNQNSRYCPTIDHIRPLSKGGQDVLENIVICNQETNEEKADTFPVWYANERRFQADRRKPQGIFAGDPQNGKGHRCAGDRKVL